MSQSNKRYMPVTGGVKAFILLALALFTAAGTCPAPATAAYQYDPHGRRDPFVPLVGVAARGAGAGDIGSILSIEDVNLQGILASGDGAKMVILNGEFVKEGGSVGRLTVESISKNEVVIVLEGEKHTLRLYE